MSQAESQLGGAAPTSVRYAYANYPQCALYNKHGLPAGPFVTALPSADSPSQQTSSQRSEGREAVVAAAAPTGPVTTPPMGLNSWNAFHCNVDERKMRAM